MYSFPTLSLFGDLVQPYRNQVVVISDSEYKKHQQAQAREQIQKLEERAQTYRNYLANVETAIAEIQKDYDLLPAAPSDVTEDK